MKQPERINFETDYEYDKQMKIYRKHLRHEEWCRNGAQKAFNFWLILGASIIGVSLLGAYLVKYGLFSLYL